SGRCSSTPQALPRGAQGGPPGGRSTQWLHTCSRISARYSFSFASLTMARLLPSNGIGRCVVVKRNFPASRPPLSPTQPHNTFATDTIRPGGPRLPPHFFFSG